MIIFIMLSGNYNDKIVYTIWKWDTVIVPGVWIVNESSINKEFLETELIFFFFFSLSGNSPNGFNVQF